MKNALNNLSSREKKMLMLLIVFAVVFGLGFGVLMPLMDKRSKLQEEITKETEVKAEKEQKLQSLAVLEAAEEKLMNRMNGLSEMLFSKMSSMQIDSKLTGMALDYGNEVTNMDIVMPKNGEYVTLGQYPVSSIDTEDQNTDQNTEDTTEDITEGTTEDTTLTGIYKSEISMTLIGKRLNLQGLIDRLSSEEPAVRIVSFSWQENGVEGEDNYTLTLKVELYMYESKEDYIAK